jgi:hypothetical protein
MSSWFVNRIWRKFSDIGRSGNLHKVENVGGSARRGSQIAFADGFNKWDAFLWMIGQSGQF